jgi:hypothetical protein
LSSRDPEFTAYIYHYIKKTYLGTSSMVHTTTVARVTEGQAFLAAALIFAAGTVAPLAYQKVKEIVKPGGRSRIFFALAAL